MRKRKIFLGRRNCFMGKTDNYFKKQFQEYTNKVTPHVSLFL